MKTLSELGISPAPWYQDDTCANLSRVSCDIHGLGRITIAPPKTTIADARLIAAAPDLYEALRYCVKFIGDAAEPLGADCETVDMIGKARAALAKASGESEVEK